ncbi:hypothetical protein C8R42DRAFT_716330 [Lentinula raphanica]|nr:hypothetical protein C8R42DRAFT_716330 [Lentinula raphanica]
MLLPLFDSRLLSYRLPRSLLLAACLLNTFVAAPPSKRELAPRDVREPVKYDLQLMKWKATGHDGAEVETTCLYFGNWNKLCSPYTLSADIRLKPNIFPVSFLPDTSWNQIGGSRISLGEAQFASESYRDHILQVNRLPPYTGIPLEDIHNFMIYLSTSFSATESKFVVTADTMEKWKQTLIEESSIKFELKEYVYESSYLSKYSYAIATRRSPPNVSWTSLLQKRHCHEGRTITDRQNFEVKERPAIAKLVH